MSKIIGIDLGTTNSVVAVMEGDSADRHHRTPRAAARRRRSWPSRRAASGWSGQVAKRQAVTNPENTIFSIKRFMGRKFAEVSEEQQDGALQGRRGAPTATSRVEIEGKLYSPPEISAMILQKMRDAAEQHLGEKVDEGGDHGPRLLQRLAAPGHQGRGQDRGPRGAAHRQRAHRGGAGLRPRQEEGRDDRGLRLRRRHLRHLGARGRRGRGRGEGHERRHPPGRRQPRPAGDRLDRRGVQEGPGHRPRRRTRWRCSG